MKLNRRQLRAVILKEMKLILESKSLSDDISTQISDEVGDRGFASFEAGIDLAQEQGEEADEYREEIGHKNSDSFKQLVIKVAKHHFRKDKKILDKVLKILRGMK